MSRAASRWMAIAALAAATKTSQLATVATAIADKPRNAVPNAAATPSAAVLLPKARPNDPGDQGREGTERICARSRPTLKLTSDGLKITCVRTMTPPCGRAKRRTVDLQVRWPIKTRPDADPGPVE